jgi:peptidyl-prolyl cis-trans isomerase SurA
MRRLSLPLVLPSILLALPLAHAEIVERVVAKVNGQIITLSEFQGRQLESALAARVDTSTIAAFLRQNNAKILQKAIDEILIQQKAEDAQMKPPPQYVDQVIGQLRKEHNLNSQQEVEAALAAEGLTFADLRRKIERDILREMVIRRDIEPKLTVSDADLRAEYERLRESDFTTPAKITLQEIVIKDEAGGEAFVQQLAARARAGEDFATLAKAHSAAATRAHGGEVGEIAENDMDPELRKVALALPIGGVSQPIRSEGGHRIVKLTARTPAATTPFEQVREKLRDGLMTTRFEKEYDAYLQELRKTAQIELRVREVPLQLTGPIPEGSLLEGLDTGLGGTPTGPVAGTEASAPRHATPGAERLAPAGFGDDEIVITPQAAPQRVAPPAAAPSAAPAAPAVEKPKGDAPGQ